MTVFNGTDEIFVEAEVVDGSDYKPQPLRIGGAGFPENIAELLMFLTPKEFEPRRNIRVWPCRLVPVEQLENDDDDKR
jgi:hypothetical protein